MYSESYNIELIENSFFYPLIHHEINPNKSTKNNDYFLASGEYNNNNNPRFGPMNKLFTMPQMIHKILIWLRM